jgi:hypothetical protein
MRLTMAIQLDTMLNPILSSDRRFNTHFLAELQIGQPLPTRCIFLVQCGSKLLFLSKRRYAI